MANEFKVKKGLIVEGSGGTILDIQGSVGQLFSITDSLTGDLFAVSDISGIPILNVNSSGAVDIDGDLSVTDDVTLSNFGAGYLKTNVNGVVSNTATIPWSTVSSTPTTISGYGITDALAIGTTATTAMAGNTSLFDGAYGSLSSIPSTFAPSAHSHNIGNITDASRWWNNFGANHTTRTQFDAEDGSLTTGFGWRYVQGSTNGPGTSTSPNQFYALTVGLGNNYDYDNYAMQLAIPRNTATPYISVRFEEGESLGSWQKISAGYADSAGSIAYSNVTGTPTLGTAAAAATGDFATAAQGTTADAALPKAGGSGNKLTDALYIQGTNTTNQESVLLRGISSNDGDWLGSIRTANTGGYNQEMRFYTSNANGTSDEDLTLTLHPTQNATFAGDITTSGEIKIVDSSATGNPKLSFYQTTNERGYIQYADTGEKLIIDSDSSLVLNTNNSPRLTIDSTGLSTFAGGLTGTTATFSGLVFTKIYKTISVSIADSYVRIAEIDDTGGQISSTVRVTLTAHGSSHVTTCNAIISVGHSQDILIQSDNLDYTTLTLKVESNSNGQWTLSAKSSSANSTAYKIDIQGLSNNISITPTPTTSQSGTTLEHTTNFGTNITGVTTNAPSSGGLKHQFGGKMFFNNVDSNTDSTTALVLDGNEVEKRTLGSNAFNSTAYITSQRAISSTPTDGATTTAISSDWAFDNVKTAVPANALFTDANTTYSAGTGLDLTGTTFSIEPDLRDGITKIGKDSSNYIAIDADDNNSIDFYVSGVWVARMEADGDLHVKGDVIAFSDVFNP